MQNLILFIKHKRQIIASQMKTENYCLAENYCLSTECETLCRLPVINMTLNTLPLFFIMLLDDHNKYLFTRFDNMCNKNTKRQITVHI